MVRASRLPLLAIPVVPLLLMPSAVAAGTVTQRVSVTSSERQGTNDSGLRGTAMSANGRFVAFTAMTSALVPHSQNHYSGVFLRDRRDGTTRLISASLSGRPGNGDSVEPSISASGRYVAFVSSASDLVTDDTNAQADVFVRDLRTGTTRRVSVTSTGAQADGASTHAQISADGRFVTFQSSASDLVRGDTNDCDDIFVRDLETGFTTRVSVSNGGRQAHDMSENPVISADGRFVAFSSLAADLVRGDTNAVWDVFVRDRLRETTTRVSVSSGGAQGDSVSYASAISADGGAVAFWSLADNLVAHDSNRVEDVFVHDAADGTTRRVSVAGNGRQANGGSSDAVMSANGRFVVFMSDATNLVARDTNNNDDIFVRDRRAGTTARVSVSTTGGQSNGISFGAAISATGRAIAFTSFASNLVPHDTNHAADVFVRASAGS